ncbi:protein-L-isoaspartate O-methyltransferase [Sphingomonas sp.]|uniref:protein-L-isoaspartate O-methyltransferase family protein n=1 Tax=Sphingomonas sp. TaxID=28214 RepID=UPI00286E8278|nr:protein-L-isoaspartate O-methyltransferase [Sphingomonas sp.]
MTIHTAIPDYAAARAAMIDSQLRPEGVTDAAVLAAMAAVSRERFVPEAARALAYGDRAVPLGQGRSMMAPAALGLLLTELAPRAGERALVVGAGGGYSAALLARIGLEVTALESSPALAAAAKANGVTVAEGALTDGHAAGAPYDLILIDGAVEQVPQALVDQLADGGRLGTALSARGVTRLAIGRKAGGGFGLHSIADAGVAALPGFARPAEFTF